MGNKGETFEFQAETRQLLNIVIHSLYTDKEIFLRELISNASDALDRLRFEALTKPELLTKDEKLGIRIESDRDKRTLTVYDNGIGMSRSEVIRNLGTIAKSGTREVLDKLKKAQSADLAAELIGQFGVGFYSAFMAADEVEVVTRRAGQKASTRWASKADGQYRVESGQREGRGTSIILHLKPADSEAGLEDFTDPHVVRRLVKRYSDFVSYPIVFRKRRQEGDGTEDETLNSMKPLWRRPDKEVGQAEYEDFYKHIAHDWEKPLKVLRYKAEGLVEYQALLFIPSRAPLDFLYRPDDYGLHLYARNVKIMEDCEDLLPRHLRFVKGVVDVSDFPLNISRQRLQNDRHIAQIRRWLAKKLLDSLAELLKKEKEAYLTVWKEFGTALKEGVAADFENREKILPLLLFPSSKDTERLTTLKEYVARMPKEQKEIYYLSGESLARLEHSPHLEAFQSKGFEVLFMTEPVDEFMLGALPSFEDRPFKSAAKGQVDLDQSRTEDLKQREEEFTALRDFLRTTLKEHVKDVRLSQRLTESPACLVGEEEDPSPHLQRLMQKAGVEAPRLLRILELNPDHEIVSALRRLLEEDDKNPALEDYAHLLMGYACLAEGSEPPEPKRVTSSLAKLMIESLK